MKKILLALSLLSILLTSTAQTSQGYDLSDSSYNYYGIWSGLKLYGIKDSTSPSTKHYFRVYTNKFQVNSVNYQNANAGVPPNVLWADDSGVVKKSPISSLVAPFSCTPDTLSASRAFNTAYLMSTTKYVDVRISASISCQLSLTGGTTGTITIETSPNGTTWTAHATQPASNTGTLTIGLNTVQINPVFVSVMIPPNYYWRATTNSATGTATFTMLQGEKITYP
jgi:hypothetical protein